MPLALVNLTLKEFFVLFKGLRAGLPILDLALQLVLVLLRLNLVLIEFLYTFLKICDDRVLQSSIFVALVEVDDQLLQLLLLLLDVNGVALQIVLLLFLEHVVQLDVEPVDNPVQLVAQLIRDSQLLINYLFRCCLMSVTTHQCQFLFNFYLLILLGSVLVRRPTKELTNNPGTYAECSSPWARSGDCYSLLI